MDLNRLTREADEQIRKVVARYNQLYIPGGTISQIELDLLLDELRKLYDTFKTIGHINQTRLQNQKKPEITIPKPPSASNQNTNAAGLEENNTNSKPENRASHPQSGIETEIPSQPEAKQEVKQDVLPEVPESSHHETEKVSDSEPPKPLDSENTDSLVTEQVESGKSFAEITSQKSHTMLADRYNQAAKSLSETISAASAKEAIGARIVLNPITDLSTGIGLNDKFSIISDLFSNNAVQYEEAISRINKAVNLDEANWILQKYQTSEWIHKQEAHARMKEFIKRRFI